MKDKDVFEGKDLHEAITVASVRLGIPEAELHYEVVQQGRKGLLGMGTKNVRIRVMRPVEHLTDHEILSGEEPRQAHVIPAPPEAAQAEVAASTDAETADGERPRRSGRRRRSGGRGGTQAAEGAEGATTATGTASPGEPSGERPRSSRSGRSRRGGRGRRPRRAAAEAGHRREGMSEEEAQAAPPEPVEPLTGQPLLVQQTLEQILQMSGLELEVHPDAADKGVALRLGGADRRMLKQRNAELLLALQFLLNRMARRAWPEVGRIRLTTNGDHEQRESQLIQLTRGAANQVAKTGRTKKLRPMNAYERRLVHLTIREYSGLTSSSDGDGAMKSVRISKVKNTLNV